MLTALLPMLITNAGRLILMSTPKGKRGFYHQAWTATDSDWERVAFRASENPRLDPAELAEHRAILGQLGYEQEYENAFNEASGQLFTEASHRGRDGLRPGADLRGVIDHADRRAVLLRGRPGAGRGLHDRRAAGPRADRGRRRASRRGTGSSGRSIGTTATASSGTSGTCRIPPWSSGSARRSGCRRSRRGGVPGSGSTRRGWAGPRPTS